MSSLSTMIKKIAPLIIGDMIVRQTEKA